MALVSVHRLLALEEVEGYHMTTATAFFQFGADSETVRNCIALMERALRGETRAQRVARCSLKFVGHRPYSLRKKRRA